jgi:DNA-binding MarR family transcriptional regulator
MPTRNQAEYMLPRHRDQGPHLLREIVRTHQALMVGFSRRVGMPASRFSLMRLLAVSESDLGVMDLARYLGVNAAAVTRQLNDMEGDGLIARRPNPRDHRRQRVSLTPKGLRLFDVIHERSHQLELALTSVISTEEMNAAAAVLGKLRNFVEDITQRRIP